MTNLWNDPAHAGGYLERADRLPHRREGEDVLVRDLGRRPIRRVLDLGCGDGRLASLVLRRVPGRVGCLRGHVADDARSRGRALRRRCARGARAARLDDPLPVEGPFDAVVSSLAIHHVSHERKRTLYAEAAALLSPGGVLANLDIVESPTPSLHVQWREEMGATDDPSDQLCPLWPQLEWLREAGLEDVDCIWKWRSLSVMRGHAS